MDKTYSYYKELKKPFFAPPSWLFGPVWTLLYIIILFTFGAVFLMFLSNEIPYYIAIIFILNLIFNILFTPIQFKLKNNLLASIDILLVLGTLIAAIILIFPYSTLIACFQIPYLIWVFYATILQISITYLNS